MTEGWLWTGQYEECKRILIEGNNHSMELDEQIINGTWTKDANGKPKFFIVNEAIISKLCILGEEFEPCFEGSQITAPIINFSYGEAFETKVYSMMNELKEYLKEGGEKVFNTYAVEIGDSLWSAIYSHIEKTYPGENVFSSIYTIDGIYEENGQKFAILRHRSDLKYYRLNFSLDESSGFQPSDMLIEVTKSYTPAVEPQFAKEDVEAYEATYAASQQNSEDNSDENDQNNSDETTEGNEENPVEPTEEPQADPVVDPAPEVPVVEDQPQVAYVLEEIPEYVELQTKYADLESSNNELNTNYTAALEKIADLEQQVASLGAFKLQVEKKEKEAMINSFYMLSDEDKKDVTDNIDKYSIDEIEAKLSILCVRNKVKFDLDEDNDGREGNSDPTTYNLNGDVEEDQVPAWVKRALDVAKNM
jgi:hypothetical protein